MGTLMIQVRSGTMMNMDTNVAVKLAAAAMDKGHAVRIFGYGEGVMLVKDGQDPRRFPNVGAAVSELVARGAEVTVCTTCTTARGIERGEEIEGTTIGSITNDLSRFISESDRMVTLAR
ncbi:sulfur reduction protein DsrE [Methanomassiliicoccales archaeon RumEn M1]|jgi:tRNA 2-thiouridine synthesizing protein D|nr:sulfur reduction protein DsrE [Methanomassiliicoccales archaeon RumEn M1]